MADLSVGDASLAGVRLIAERPRSVLIWSLIYLLVAALMSIPTFSRVVAEGQWASTAQRVSNSGVASSAQSAAAAVDRLHATEAAELQEAEESGRQRSIIARQKAAIQADLQRANGPTARQSLLARATELDVASANIARQAAYDLDSNERRRALDSRIIANDTGDSKRAASGRWLQSGRPRSDHTLAMGLVSLISTLFALTAFFIISSSICRAILDPGSRNVAYLNFGRTEFNVGISFIFLLLGYVGLIFITIISLVIGLMIITAIVGHNDPGFAELTAIITGGIASLIAPLAMTVFFYLFGLSVPMAFAKGGFRLAEVWSLSRTMKKFLSVTGLLVLAQISVLVAFFYGFSVIILNERSSAPVAGASIAWALPPIFGMACIWGVKALLAGPATVVFVAPLAAIYRAIGSPPATAIADTGP